MASPYPVDRMVLEDQDTGLRGRSLQASTEEAAQWTGPTEDQMVCGLWALGRPNRIAEGDEIGPNSPNIPPKKKKSLQFSRIEGQNKLSKRKSEAFERMKSLFGLIMVKNNFEMMV